MKNISLVLTIAILLITGCANKSPKPILTKTAIKIEDIKAPRKIGSYELEGQKDYSDKKLGIGLRYIDKSKYKAYLDAFVYPKNESLEEHYSSFKSALNFMAKKGKFKSLKLLREDELMLDAQTKVKRALYEIYGPTVPYYSVAYIAPIDSKHFFKVRISNPLISSYLTSDLGLSAVKELFHSIKIGK